MEKINEIWVEGLTEAAKRFIECGNKSLGLEFIALPAWEDTMEKILNEINKDKPEEERGVIINIWREKSFEEKRADCEQSDYNFEAFIAQITSHPLLAALAAIHKN